MLFLCFPYAFPCAFPMGQNMRAFAYAIWTGILQGHVFWYLIMALSNGILKWQSAMMLCNATVQRQSGRAFCNCLFMVSYKALSKGHLYGQSARLLRKGDFEMQPGRAFLPMHVLWYLIRAISKVSCNGPL